MAQEEKSNIEIPFGAKDSELCGWEYTIPEGMEAEIVDGKVIVRKKEDRDEKIRKTIIEAFQFEFTPGCKIISSKDVTLEDAISWLEKQKKQKEQKPDQAPFSWPNLSNCKHNCKICMAKCFYRKEPYQWKPTDEQMKALNKVANDGALLDLFNDLLKLM